MKIVHLIWGLNVGGAETMLADIANAQAENHDVWLIIGNKDVNESIASSFDSRVHPVFLGRRPGSPNPWPLMKMVFLLWRIRPDVIHAHQESFIHLKKLMPAPLVLTIHGTGHKLDQTVARYDGAFCISEAVKTDVMSRLPGCHPAVVHNGVSFLAIANKQRYGQMPFRVVQVSRLDHEIKGQDILIRALKRVNEVLGEGNVLVDFIGGGASFDYLQNLAIECRVEQFCRFLGIKTRQYVYANLCHYDLLVQPSRYEGFGLTVVEGIAAGLPVLVSDREGPMEIIEGGRLGECFTSEDFADCAAKILEIVEASKRPDYAQMMEKRTAYARSRFDIHLTAENYVNEYQKLASSSF